MAGSGRSGDGEVVDLAAFRRHSEDRKLRDLFAALLEPTAEEIVPAPDPEPSSGLVVEVGRDVWPGTSPLDTLTARADVRDLSLIAECRAEALAAAPGPAQPDDVADGVAVLRAFLNRLGDEGLPLAGERGIAESSIELALLGDGNLGLWKGEGLGAAPQHPARRVRAAATALGLARAQGRTLVATRRGALLRESPAALWDHVVTSLPLERTPGGREAGLLVILLTAAGRATPDRSFERTVNSIGERLRRNSPDPDFSPRDALREAARTLDVLSWAGHARIGRLGLDQPRFPRWAGLEWSPASRLARAAVGHLI